MQRQKKIMEGVLAKEKEFTFKYMPACALAYLNFWHDFIYYCYNAEIKGFDPNIEEVSKLEEADDEGKPSQGESSSDTTDADEAGDLEELLDPGDPVYFNYATAESIPSSLTVSLKRCSGCVFTYTNQPHPRPIPTCPSFSMLHAETPSFQRATFEKLGMGLGTRLYTNLE